MLLFYKSVDKSTLTEGFAIPSVYCDVLGEALGVRPKRGEKRTISVVVDDVEYASTLKNINFDERKYPTHKDIVQIRYAKASALAVKLREKFERSQNLLQTSANDAKILARLPENQKEFLAVYSTSRKGTILLDCITNAEFNEEASELLPWGELAVERWFDGRDPDAGIVVKTKVCKIRTLNRTIGDDLKKAYGYRCQICGQFIGEPYGSTLIHAHHIQYFTRSLNNNPSNIMILCPNHHYIIHDREPIYRPDKKEFHYRNGFVEKLLLNLHL
ncbi:MAG: hypothetical protein IKU86_13665 [Thermoguttaceae bacterium]|nr:hypothetical protein [Thermoguttaceae bacterium]